MSIFFQDIDTKIDHILCQKTNLNIFRKILTEYVFQPYGIK